MNHKQLIQYRKSFYINLEKYIKENDRFTMDDYHLIVGKSISQCEKKEKTSKKIFVYYGTYEKNDNDLSLINKSEIDESKYLYNIYRDIETFESYIVKYKKSKKFEKENKVIIPKYDLYTMDEINKKFELIRFNYYKNLLVDSQNSSYKLIKKNIE